MKKNQEIIQKGANFSKTLENLKSVSPSSYETYYDQENGVLYKELDVVNLCIINV